MIERHRHLIRRGLVFLIFCRCLLLVGNFVMVGSPRLLKYLGIEPKRALEIGPQTFEI